ncbi:MAG: TrkH family potassium uptake protein [Alphaproteobacteria bacterium]|nr:TrkH family potassium uptake protein [Alphaproteobacteria bacterium]
MDFRPILFVVGLLLCILSITMTLPMLLDLSLHNPDWKVFFFCVLVTGFFGGSLVISTSQQSQSLTNRQAFMLLFLGWLCVAVFGSLPFHLSEMKLSLTDSLFESMSGITTTGATVMKGLDMAPPGILLWRALLQWLGGMGIVMMALTVLPLLKVGGMQLFRSETGEDERSLPRMAKLTYSVGFVYLGLTLLCAIVYMSVGMGTFDSFMHALTTISTGGFSTHDKSLAYYNNPWIEGAAMIFMIAGALPFILYVRFTAGKPAPLLKDTQVRVFLVMAVVSTLCLALYLIYEDILPPLPAFRYAAFNIISVLTGTGYTNTTAFWGPFAFSLFLFLMAVGGCAGSTTCGIRIFRFQVLYEVMTVQIRRLLNPNGVFVPYYNRRPVPPDVPLSVMSFFFLYAMSFTVLALILSFIGLEPVTAISSAMAALSNAGPSNLDAIDSAVTFADLPSSAKWVLCGGMLIGRLEIFTVLVFLLPQYWRP